jgi:hypothetical protein
MTDTNWNLMKEVIYRNLKKMGEEIAPVMQTINDYRDICDNIDEWLADILPDFAPPSLKALIDQDGFDANDEGTGIKEE